MARIRTIKPEFWTDEKVVECSLTARLLFIGLWNFADDAGRLEDAPRQIKMKIFPGDDFSADDVHGMLNELSVNGLIIRYRFDEKAFIQVKGWSHQKIYRPNPSKFPPPAGGTHGTVSESHLPEKEFGREKEGKRRSDSIHPAIPACAVAEPRLVDGASVDDLRIFVWRMSGMSDHAVQTRLVSTRVEGVRQVRGWLDAGLTPDQIRAAVTRAYDSAEARDKTIRHPWVYLDQVMKSEVERLAQAAKEAESPHLAGGQPVAHASQAVSADGGMVRGALGTGTGMPWHPSSGAPAGVSLENLDLL